MRNADTLKSSGNLVHAIAVVAGYFSPWWLVSLLCFGWLFNAGIYAHRALRELKANRTDNFGHIRETARLHGWDTTDHSR